MNHYGTIMKHYEPLTSIFPRLSTSNQRTPGRSLWHLEGSSCLAVCSWDSTGPPMVTSGDPNDLTQQYLGLVATGACKSFSSYCWWYIYIIHTYLDAMPRHAMPCHHPIQYLTLHYITLDCTTITLHTHEIICMCICIYIYIYLRVCVCLCVYPYFVGSHPAIGKFLSPMFEIRSKLAQNSGIKLYVGEFGPGLSKFRQPRDLRLHHIETEPTP